MELLQAPRWDTDLEPSKRRSSLLDQLEAWIKSPTLSDLASYWGLRPRDSLSPSALFEWYDEFSSQRWDYRKGQERNLALPAELTSSQKEAAMKAADAIGLINARHPQRSQYEFMLILGGLIRACITRPRYARELIDTGVVVENVIALGGFRSLAGDEIALSKQLKVDANNEFEAMIAGLRAAFPFLGQEEVKTSAKHGHSNADWAIARFDDANISVIAAPSRDPERRRANTADTFTWWAEGIRELRGRHVLLVTNPIYVPYQAAAAIENLGMPFNVSVETVGISDAAANLGSYTQPFSLTNYLQEIRSAIRGYKSLYATASRTEDTAPRSDAGRRDGAE